MVRSMNRSTYNFERAKKLMENERIDVLIAATPLNFVYTSGWYNRAQFTLGSNAYTVISREEPDKPTLIVSESNAPETAEETWIQDRAFYKAAIVAKDAPRVEAFGKDRYSAPTDVLSKVVKDRGLDKGTIGLEMTVSVNHFKQIERKLPEAKFVDAYPLFRNLRSIKAEEEIDKIRRAAKITEKAIEAAWSLAGEGITETEVVNELKSVMTKEGGEVAHLLFGAGIRSAIPMKTWGNYRIQKGDIIRFDGGAGWEGYVTDFARMAVIGQPSEKLQKVYGTLLGAEQKVIESIRPGMRMDKLFHIGQDFVRERGFSWYTREASCIAHGVGMEIVDEPYINPFNTNPLEVGMTLSVEVPMYIYGWAGLNIEDIVVVREDGHEYLTTIDRELRVL
jgi:Xaa-Pro dipeptidase